ncbi:MAG: BolA family transcriptional regulator [Alphaproteobacteria bacterium]|nr:BolA family transcriptional regulator [Alphaproteobacteria bacterium]
MSVRERIINRLTQVFSPIYLEVVDFSEQHHGHAGYRDGGGSHIEVVIVTDLFVGKTLPDQHRLVYEALNEEIENGLHALKIKTLTLEQAHKRNLKI